MVFGKSFEDGQAIICSGFRSQDREYNLDYTGQQIKQTFHFIFSIQYQWA